MKKYEYEGKTKEEAVEKALAELKINEKDLIINVLEEKSTLLKKNVKIEVINYNDLINYIKETILEITKLMGLSVNLEVRRREENITIKIFSDHNAVLIGKNGKVLEALQTIIRQIVQKETKEFLSIILDVENYIDAASYYSIFDFSSLDDVSIRNGEGSAITINVFSHSLELLYNC